MWGFAEKVKEAEAILENDPINALKIIKQKHDEIEEEIDSITKLGEKLSAISNKIGHAAFVLEDKGKSFRKDYTQLDVDNEIKRDLRSVVDKLRDTHPLFNKVVKSMKKIEK